MATWDPTPLSRPRDPRRGGRHDSDPLRNNDKHYKQPHSLHPHGVRYAPESDGSWTASDTKPGSAMAFGESYTYSYQALPSSLGTWIYHDHSVPFRIPGAGPGRPRGRRWVACRAWPTV